ncbi:hypothetical protein GB927_012755 [Shinella sp. CPCC 100929]|uniref:Uncharacterized protein n=1 Tax=Shinella lacus TaxID=2654216 RepID=A0ABT1R6X5_9HYPH|nr:hypothetical protein [Shinella lacus]MCQ4630915.1 hypothetical protein [Shinella lacus]
MSRRVPKGAMGVVAGHGNRLRRVLRQHGGLQRDGQAYLLPALRTAVGDRAAILAIEAFMASVREILARGPHRRFRGGRLL